MTGNRRKTAILLAALLFAIGFIPAAPATAVDSAWNVNSAGNWSDAANWTAGVPNAIDDIARLTYNITAARTVTIDGSSRTVGSLFLNDDNFGYTLAGVGLKLDVSSGSALIQSDGGGAVTHTISAPVNLYDSSEFNVGNATTLQISGSINSAIGGTGITKTGTGLLALTGANAYTGGTTLNGGILRVSTDVNLGTPPPSPTTNITFGGGTLQFGNDSSLASSRNIVLNAAGGTIDTNGHSITIGSVVSGNGGLTKTGDGLLDLSAANDYSGVTTLAAGTLSDRASSLYGVPMSSNLVLAGGIFTIRFGGTFNRSLGTGPGQVQWTGSAGFGSWQGDLYINLGNQPDYATVTWGAGGFVPDGAELVFKSPGDGQLYFLNPIDLAGGTRTVRSLGGGVPTPFTLSSTLSNGSLVKAGVGTLVLAGNNTYAGTTTVAEGVLRVTNTNALGSAAGPTVVLKGAQIQMYGFINISYEPLVLAGDGPDGNGALYNPQDNSANTWEGPISLADDASLGTSSRCLTVTGPLATNGHTLTLAAGHGSDLGIIRSAISGTGGVTKIGPGTWLVTGNSTYSGLTRIKAGALRLGGPNVLPGTSLSLEGGTLDMDRWDYQVDTLSGYGAILLGTGNLTIGPSSGICTLTAAVSGTGGVTKVGNGKLQLGTYGNNSYSGATTIEGGVLEGKLPASSNLTLNGGVFSADETLIRTLGAGPGQVQWLGSGGFNGNIHIGTDGNDSPLTWGVGGFVPDSSELFFCTSMQVGWAEFHNPIDFNGKVRTIRVFDNPGSTTDGAIVSGVLSGTGGLNKAGPGTLQLAAANTYSGETTVSEGTLYAPDPAAFGTGVAGVTVLAGATLSNASASGKPLTLNGNGVGGLGALVGSDWNGPVTLATDSSINASTIRGTISGNASLTLVAGGALLTAANTYTGTTHILSGMLSISDSASLGTPQAGTTVEAGGTLSLNNNITMSAEPLTLHGGALGGIGTWSSPPITLTADSILSSVAGGPLNIDSIISDGGQGYGITKSGAGIVNLRAANQYGGPTTLSGGVLHAVEGVGLPAASNLALTQEGLYEVLGPTTFTRGLGAAGGQVRWTGSGGFSAIGGKMTVAIGGMGSLTPLVWGTGGFVPDGSVLCFGSPSADSETELMNLINLGGATRTFKVFGATATLSGAVSGGGIVKDGPGTLRFASNGVLSSADSLTVTGGGTLDIGPCVIATGSLTLTDGAINGAAGRILATAYDLRKGSISTPMSGTGGVTKTTADTVTLTGVNTYLGETILSGGLLKADDAASLPTNSGLVFSGGTLESAGNATFIRSLGTGAGQVRWTGRGGFSAVGGKLTVAIGGLGSPTPLTVGAGGFVPAGQPLIFGSTTATGETDFRNSINLGGAVRTVSVTDNTATDGDFVTFSGVISNGGISKAGAGTLALTGANVYTATTDVTAGVLRAVDGVGLPAASNLKLRNGSVLEGNGAATFTRGLGTGSGQVQWSTSGGFSAHDGKMTVALGGLDSPPALTWGTGNFVSSGSSLYFGSLTANAEVEFKNAIDLAGGTRSVCVTDNPAMSGDFATISGILFNGSLSKTGGGTLALAGANAYAGLTTISAGALRATDGVGLPAAGNLILAGGVLEGIGATTFTRSMSTIGGTVQWTAGGGFSASGGKMTVAIGGTGSPTQLVWGAGNFVPLGAALMFGSPTATSETELMNAIDLAGGNRTFNVDDNPATTADFATISGAITNGSITKTGPGTLILSGPNTFTGSAVQGGTLLVQTQTVGGPGPETPVTVAAATLGGTGFINGPVTLTGDSTLTSTGTLTINSTLDVQGLTNQLAAGTVNTTGDVTIEPGAVFIVNGTLGGGTGSLVVYGTLMGQGTINKSISLEAGGVLSPGSPSTIETMAQMHVGAATKNLAFEIAAAAPNYATPSNSLNDLVRLTSIDAPFADATGSAPAALSADTVIDVYFLAADPALGDYKAQFFAATDFTDAIAGATFQYWRLDPHGTRLYNGNFYSPLDESLVDWSVVPETAVFDGLAASGYITEFTVVPEPATLGLVAMGVAGAMLRRRRK